MSLSAGVALLLFAGNARAFTFGEVVSTPLLGEPLDVAIYTLGSGDAAAYVAESGGWEAYRSEDGAVPSVAGTAAAGGELLYFCSGGGLSSWSGTDVAAVGGGCADVEARDERILLLGATLVLQDGVGPDVDLGVSPDLYSLAPSAAYGAPVAWADVGDTAIQQYDAFGTSSLAVGGEITALGWGVTDWVVGTPTGFRQLGEAGMALSVAPIQVGAADFDADGISELWAFDGEVLTVVGETGQATLAVTADQLVIGDVDGDACADVVGILGTGGGGSLVTVDVIDCAGDVDVDGDGYLPGGDGPIDCGPDDPAIHPFASEICDGVDQDCDGVVDELNFVSVDAPSAEEGTVFSFTATPDGCLSETGVWDWSFLGEAECSGDGQYANCLALDDAEVTATLEVTTVEGLRAQAASTVTVVNLPPYLVDDATDWGSHSEGVLNKLDLDAEELYTVQLVAADAGIDAITFSMLADGVPATLTPDGLLTITGGADELEFPITIRLEDDDGGISDHVFTIRIGFTSDPAEPEPTDSGLCCGGGSLSALAGLSILSGVFRKRRY